MGAGAIGKQIQLLLFNAVLHVTPSTIKFLVQSCRLESSWSSPGLADTGTQSKMNATVKNSKMARRYGEEFKRQAVELMIHSGKTQRQVARELDVSEYSLNLWKKAYLGQQAPAEIEGEMKSPEEMAQIIRQQHKEIEYLKKQREILKKAMSILGEEPNPGMR
jgi:transposase